jgi:hypothetical protein
VSVEGQGTWPAPGGGCDAVLTWKVRFEFAGAAPITFVNQNAEGIEMGAKFTGDSGWVHVTRGAIKAGSDSLLRDPANKDGAMPIKLPVSLDHTRNFVDAVKSGTRAICDIGTSVRSDMLCQLASIALKAERKLAWDPRAESFPDDEAANALLNQRPFRGDWKLPEV